MIDHTFSAKPKPAENYDGLLPQGDDLRRDVSSATRRLLSPKVTAKTFPVIEPARRAANQSSTISTPHQAGRRSHGDEEAGRPQDRIVGLGGTGSYVLDLVAKTR